MSLEVGPAIRSHCGKAKLGYIAWVDSELFTRVGGGNYKGMQPRYYPCKYMWTSYLPTTYKQNGKRRNASPVRACDAEWLDWVSMGDRSADCTGSASSRRNRRSAWMMAGLLATAGDYESGQETWTASVCLLKRGRVYWLHVTDAT